MTTSETRTPRQSRSLRTREQIVKSALTLFVRKGYPETSMEDICRESRTSKGGLYHHFATKEAVLLSALDLVQRVGGWQAVAQRLSVEEGTTDSHVVQGLQRLVIDVWGAAFRSEPVRNAAAATAGNGQQGGPLTALLVNGQLVQALVQQARLPAERERPAA
jgi:AcrR family transcriptional regulator